MKTILILLTASALALTAIPLATAEQECGRAGTTEAIAHPTQRDAYLFIDVTQPAKVGEWLETNGARGLQTMQCIEFGIFQFRADLHTDILG